ncbi:hypothetical protein [Sphingomonas sp. S2-65]|uniref:hypothetical protein n=1 Tax=Sphingomonas sp. S2-65 TaxID=2903960 RepID=UPI001F316DC9|nr:hypothetical protein [Sphingomonas sp. S2-65]UYY57241.1 hypothetical protein LZ586_11135 [Sphingomonas sp. S2-65]
MNALIALDRAVAQAGPRAAPTQKRPRQAAPPVTRAPGGTSSLPYFAYRTAVNAARYISGLRPFQQDDFGKGPNTPSRAHLAAVNGLIAGSLARQGSEERQLAVRARDLTTADDAGRAALLKLKELGETRARDTEQLWEFYLNLFGQRNGPFASWLGALDRIALDCYQAVYLGLGKARSIPSPAPFAYMEAGFGPATFRRGVKLGKIGQLANPFPLVKVPYLRLLNPWSLGAVPHEVSHNLQNDLGLWNVIPGRIAAAFRRRNLPSANAAVWERWHKETYADLSGLLLIGPAYVGALMDVVGRSRESTAAWNDEAVHPTPIIRVPLNARLLERIGFHEDAAAYRRAWDALYPASAWARVPGWVRARLPEQIDAVLDAICFAPCVEYGGRALIDVIRFEPKHAELVREAADRLQTGTDTGVLPERFLIAAARQALSRAKTPPQVIARNFYEALGRC